MKKFILVIAMAFCAFALNAQNDERPSGLYAVDGEESVKLTFLRGVTSNSGVNVLGLEIGERKYIYKGETSDTHVKTSSFVIVCDMNKSVIKGTLKDFDCFVKTTTPDNFIIVPLEVIKNKRQYSDGTSIYGINTERKTRFDFSWEQISDNSFAVEVDGLEPGEYAFVFKASGLSPYEFAAIFDFTVVE